MIVSGKTVSEVPDGTAEREYDQHLRHGFSEMNIKTNAE
jgi:hypothetical protein